MTVKSPEVIYLIDTGDGIVWCDDQDPTGYGECDAEKYVRWNAYEALQAECEKLRACLAETAGVAVTMLYESHKADTIKEFTVEQLSQMVETTKHLADANVQVEKVYRKAWDMAHGCAGSYLEGAQP